MELCSLYNRLGKLIRKRSAVERAIKFVGDSDFEQGKKLKKQVSDIVTDIENINREIDAKENR